MLSKLETVTASANRSIGDASHVPKLCGADFELGNFVLGLELPKGSGALASHLLLREIAGLPYAHKRYASCSCPACRARQDALASGFSAASLTIANCASNSSDSAYNPQDWARKFLSENGGCAYIDLDHLELCIPEVLSARDHLAASHA